MFIQRDYNRTEEDDFKLNVQDKLRRDNKEAMPVYEPSDHRQEMVIGWILQNKYE